MSTDTSRLTIWKADPAAPTIVPADSSAAGTMPAAAFQYCEAMRAASSWGHYVYPPRDISLFFDGHETSVHHEGTWRPAKSYEPDADGLAAWRASAPADITDRCPPFLTGLFVPGAVQLWSGYFAKTQPGDVLLVRPPVNADFRSVVRVFEGIVETDVYSPWPIFANLQLLKSDIEIYLPQDRPLFQIQVIPRTALTCKGQGGATFKSVDDSSFPWDGLKETVRQKCPDFVRRPGRYGSARRKGRGK